MFLDSLQSAVGVLVYLSVLAVLMPLAPFIIGATILYLLFVWDPTTGEEG